MSKTYRRQTQIWSFTDYEYDWENGYLKKIRLTKNSKKYKKLKAHFHSDNYTGWGVPHWYVNLYYERPNRAKTKKIISQWVKNPNDDVIIDRHIKNAGWTYW